MSFAFALQPESELVGAKATPAVGFVPALSAVSVSVTLRALFPGESRVKCWVAIAGVDTPFKLQLIACASGPKLKVEPRELHWGKVRNYNTLLLACSKPNCTNRLLTSFYFCCIIRQE